jgi:hypothetical protein
MNQAVNTVNEYFDEAIRYMNFTYGQDYRHQHPEMVIAIAQTYATEAYKNSVLDIANSG